jgi:alanine dehydrogenase
LQHFRVGADAAMGARYVAREDAHVLGMFGSGGMARSHVEALRLVRPIDRIQVFSPTREHREAYAREMAERYDIEAIAVDDPREVCRGADIVCECTDAAQRVVMGRWLEPGAHITAVGNHFDAEVYERTDVSLRLGTAPAPVGLPQWATERGSVTYAAGSGRRGLEQKTKSHRTEARFKNVISLEELLAGREAGRTSQEQITHSTRGNLQGAQFFAVAGAVYEAARVASVGRELPTEWFLQDIRD